MSCALCGGKKHVLVLVKKGYHLVRCVDCDLLFVANAPDEKKLRELHSHKYQRKYEHSQKARDEFMPHCERNWEVFKRWTSPGSVLDVGCSIGGFLSLCVGYDAIGLEINPATRKVAQEHFQVTVHNLTLAEYHRVYPFRSFRYVTMWDVLEHLPDQNETSELVRRILHPGGLLFIETADASGLFLKDECLSGANPAYRHPLPPYHVVEYSVDTLTKMLQKHEFETLEIIKIPVGPDRPRAIMTLVARRVG